MTLNELNNLDPQNIGNWPLPIRIVIISLVCVAVTYGAWQYMINPKLDVLTQIEQEEETLKETFKTKQQLAANLKMLKEQLQEMQQSFGDMLEQLPDKTEVAGLIVDISQAGLAAGLKFELFQPGAEQSGEFYVELPISIRVVGSYHQLGEFVSSIAALPRIVTTHDISINKQQKDGNDGQLVMQATAKTYRALSEEEEA